MTISFNIDLFCLVFMRFMGMVMFNPLLGRTSVPTTLKAGFSLLCAFAVTPTLHMAVSISGPVQMIVSLILELTVGLAVGVLLNIVFSVVLLAGELVDAQMGLGMAMQYDPGSGIQTPVFGNLFNVILMVVFFASDAHLSLITLMSESFGAIAPGTAWPTAGAEHFLVAMGGDMLRLGFQMAVPVMAVELICVVAIGLLMKAVPQINIFTMGIQVEAIAGILVVLVSSSSIVGLCGRLTTYALEKITELLRLLVH